MNIFYRPILGYFLLISSVVFSQTLKVIDNKGTISEIETSKWTSSGNDIYNINTGNVGIGSTTPNPSAKLDINTTTGGLLPPRLTTLQRDAILSPAKGLIIFNTTNNGLEVNTGTALQAVWTSATSEAFLPIEGGTMMGGINGTILTLNNNSGNNATTIGAGSTTGPVTIGGTGTQTINIGSGDGIKTVTVGSGTGTSSTAFKSGTGLMSFTPAATGNIVIGNENGTGFITLGSSAGAQTVNIGSGAGVSKINIARNDKTNIVAIGGINTVVGIGTNNPTVSGTGLVIEADGDTQPRIALKNGITGKGIADGFQMGIDYQMNVFVEQRENANYSISTNLKDRLVLTGNGSTTLTPDTAGTILLGASAGTGAITLGSSFAAQTTNIGTGSGASTVNIATGAGSNTVTVGGLGGASATTIQAGTGNLNIKSGNSPIIFNTNGTEKMRLLTDGTLCLGTSTASGIGSRFMITHTGGINNGLIVQNLNTNSSYALATVNSSGTLIGGVSVNGSTTAFATTSDYRLKKDFDG